MKLRKFWAVGGAPGTPSLIVVIVFELKVVFLESEEHFAHFRSHVLSDGGIGCPAGGEGFQGVGYLGRGRVWRVYPTTSRSGGYFGG